MYVLCVCVYVHACMHIAKIGSKKDDLKKQHCVKYEQSVWYYIHGERLLHTSHTYNADLVRQLVLLVNEIRAESVMKHILRSCVNTTTRGNVS